MSTLNEILQFEVYKADATLDRNTMHVRLFYPNNPKKIDTRIPENLQFGKTVLNRLRNLGYDQIADQQNPIKPPSAGSVYITLDDKLIIHRRDANARTNALYHSIYAGFTSSRDFLYSEKGLIDTALRETAEECLLITKDNDPYLIVPNDSKQDTIESAKRLGLDLKPRFVDVQTLPANDTLEVLTQDGESIYKTNVWLELYYTGHTGISVILFRKLPLHSQEILPVDAEGMMSKDNKFIHFNRESYIVDPKDIPARFGFPLKNAKSYQTLFLKDGEPKVYEIEHEPPFYGPDKVRVNDPHIFAPDDLLAKVVGILIWDKYDYWIDEELHKIESKLQNKSLVPEQFLIKA